MYIDPVVEEMEKIKDEHAKKYNYDIDAIVEALREKQKEHADRVVSLEVARVAEEPGKYE